jgi:hypothetical protein
MIAPHFIDTERLKEELAYMGVSEEAIEQRNELYQENKTQLIHEVLPVVTHFSGIQYVPEITATLFQTLNRMLDSSGPFNEIAHADFNPTLSNIHMADYLKGEQAISGIKALSGSKNELEAEMDLEMGFNAPSVQSMGL